MALYEIIITLNGDKKQIAHLSDLLYKPIIINNIHRDPVLLDKYIEFHPANLEAVKGELLEDNVIFLLDAPVFELFELTPLEYMCPPFEYVESISKGKLAALNSILISPHGKKMKARNVKDVVKYVTEAGLNKNNQFGVRFFWRNKNWGCRHDAFQITWLDENTFSFLCIGIPTKIFDKWTAVFNKIRFNIEINSLN